MEFQQFAPHGWVFVENDQIEGERREVVRLDDNPKLEWTPNFITVKSMGVDTLDVHMHVCKSIHI